MLPDPLHPALVHFPVALAFLVPLFALIGALAVRAGRLPRSAWAGVLLLQLLLAGSGWLAVETGEGEEERVESAVAERHIERHEEAAERFLWAAVLLTPIAAAGLAAGTLGSTARAATVALSLVVLGVGAQAGHTGGELVHRYGAPLAYAAPGETGPVPEGAEREGDSDSDSHRRPAAIDLGMAAPRGSDSPGR